MVINFQHTLQEALKQIEHQETKDFLIHPHQTERILTNTDYILQIYADAKWEIVNTINQQYQTNFNLYNWLNKKEDDVAHFLNEAGSNTLNYSEFKTPHKFQLHLGKKGFIISIHQLGKTFNAHHINKNQIKNNQGKAFTFFRLAKSTIFFNHPHLTTNVFMQKLIKN